jgi:hypothetical protein
MHRIGEEFESRHTVAPWGRVPPLRLALLFVLFFLICCGLGYPSLNRVDWRQAPGGLDDVRQYANLVVARPAPDLTNHVEFRVLIPYLARPIYRLTKDRIGTWDPIMFGLLVVNSFFVAATVSILLVVVYGELDDYSVALGSALIYLLNFAVPNLRLAGFIDAGEGFFLMAVTWSLWRRRYWMLPVWAILGAMAKESFVPFLTVFSLSWWICEKKRLRDRPYAATWIVGSWVAALVSLTLLQWKIAGVFRSPLSFGLELHQDSSYFSHFFGSFADRNLWYIFVWLLPLSLFRLKRFPLEWKAATAVTSIIAFTLDAYYGGGPGTIGRALFSVAGPLLSAAVAMLIFTGVQTRSVDQTQS